MSYSKVLWRGLQTIPPCAVAAGPVVTCARGGAMTAATIVLVPTHLAHIRVQLPTSCPDAALFQCLALGRMPSGP